MSQQNPTIPTATQAKGIDAVVNDLQTHLSFDLSWLTNGLGRAYRKNKTRSNGVSQFLPMVYLGTNFKNDFFNATPDNDKQGQNFILVGDATHTQYQTGFYGELQYPISIIFSANLDTIDSALLATEDFTEHLMEDVRESLVRNLIGKPYRLQITNETREFEDVYSEFDIGVGTTNKPFLPMTYFRFDCDLIVKEDCAGVVLDRCTAILQNLTSTDLLDCILPTYDFSDPTTQEAVTAQQQSDLQAWLCMGATYYSMDYDGVDELLFSTSAPSMQFQGDDPFTCMAWVKITAIKNMQPMAYYDLPNDKGWILIFSPSGKVQLRMRSDSSFALGTFGFIESANDVLTPHLNQWVHVAATKNNEFGWANAKIYINGVSMATTAFRSVTDVVDYSLGNPAVGGMYSSTGVGTSFDGKIFTSRVYARDLTQSEVSIEANNMTNEAIVTLNLVMDPDITNSVYTGTPYAFDVPDASPTAATFNGFNLELADKTTDTP